jgi:large subunit ribosomal protein L1
VKRESVNTFVTVPHTFKKIKAAAFLTTKSKIIDTITKAEFDQYKGKEAKKLIKNYDLFIAHASLMPAIATSFGKVLGPVGKMPSPQLGIITREDDSEINGVLDKANKMVRVKTKEPSIKVCVGKEEMTDEELEENIMTVYNAVFNLLPKKKENLKSVIVKFTMSKPAKMEF